MARGSSRRGCESSSLNFHLWPRQRGGRSPELGGGSYPSFPSAQLIQLVFRRRIRVLILFGALIFQYGEGSLSFLAEGTQPPRGCRSCTPDVGTGAVSLPRIFVSGATEKPDLHYGVMH